jgi:hypothetical protein
MSFLQVAGATRREAAPRNRHKTTRWRKTSFSLDGRSDFGEARYCQIESFPGFVPDIAGPPSRRVAVFLGLGFLRTVSGHACFRHTRPATVPQHAACRNVISPNIRMKRSSAAACLGAAQPNR